MLSSLSQQQLFSRTRGLYHLPHACGWFCASQRVKLVSMHASFSFLFLCFSFISFSVVVFTTISCSECEGPVAAPGLVGCAGPRDTPPVLPPFSVGVRGSCAPFAGAVLTAPRDAPKPLCECGWPVPPSASVVCIDLVGRLFSSWNLQERERVGPVPSPVCHRLYRSAGRSSRCILSCCLRVWSLYPLPRMSSVPTPRDALPAAVRARGACTPFRECRLYRPRGTLGPVHHP